MKKYFLITVIFLCFEVFPLDPASLQVPDGFAIEVFAQEIDAPRQMAQGDRGLFLLAQERLAN